MCGLVGFLGGIVGAASNKSLLRRMADTLIHRGPDDEGLWCDSERNIGLGHRRLSIPCQMLVTGITIWRDRCNMRHLDGFIWRIKGVACQIKWRDTVFRAKIISKCYAKNCSAS